MSYERNPPARARFSEDEVLPPVPLVFAFRSLAWLVGTREEKS